MMMRKDMSARLSSPLFLPAWPVSLSLSPPLFRTEISLCFDNVRGRGGRGRRRSHTTMDSSSSTKACSVGSDKDGSESSAGAEERGVFEIFGWVYHLGVNSIGREYCHLRFLFIRGKYVEMYKRDPHENPGIVRFPLLLFWLLFCFWVVEGLESAMLGFCFFLLCELVFVFWVKFCCVCEVGL